MAISTNRKNTARYRASKWVKAKSRSPVVYFLMALLIVFGFASFVWMKTRPSMEKAEQLLSMGAYTDAVDMISYLAESGDGKAIFMLGKIYYEGKVVPSNHAKALPYLAAAANHGNTEATIMLANVYYLGTGGTRDFTKVLRYLAPLEDTDNAGALALVGRMFYYGHGVQQDYERANQLLNKALILGSHDVYDLLGLLHYNEYVDSPSPELARAMLSRVPPGEKREVDYALGRLYYHGRGGPRELDLAAERLLMVDPGDDPMACFYVGIMHFLSAKFQADYQEALRLLTFAKDNGVKDANLPLGVLYLRGYVGDAPDYRLAKEYLEAAAANNDPSGYALLGEIYYEGLGVPKDYEKAFQLLKQSVELPDADPYNFFLGKCYYYGRGVARSYAAAAPHIMYEAGLDNVEAETLLATMYYNGNGVEKSYDKALFFLKKGLEEDYPPALGLRGRMYLYGDGGDWDENKAGAMLQKAADGGDVDAVSLLQIKKTRDEQKQEREKAGKKK